MDNRKKRIRRAIVDVLLELAGLVVLAVCLWNIQTDAVVRQQENNSLTKLNIAQQRMTQNAEEAEDNLATYDAFSQAKVDTIAYYLTRNPDSADLDALCTQWGLNVYYRLDAAGKVLQSNAAAARQDVSPFAEAMQTMTPVSMEEQRYYFTPMADGGMLIGGRDVTAENALLDELRSPTYALNTIKVGTTGYILAVNEADGTLAYHPDDALMGTDAASAGYDPATFAAGYDGWVTLNGIRVYCMSRSVDGYLMAAIVPEAELMSTAGRTTGLSVVVFAIVMSLLMVYSLILRQEQDKRPTCQEEYKQIGKLYLDRVVAAKIRNVALIGLVVVFLATFYMQTLSALSRQSMLSDIKLTSVEEILENNDVRVQELTDEYSAEYVQRARNIAWTIAQDPTLVDDDSLTDLAKNAQITALYVFNKAGRVVATNTNYKDFVLSNDEEDQSYPFWPVVKGYLDELIQPVGQDDTMMHNFIQYVGVRRLDDAGMVELGLSPRRIANRLHTTELPYVLSEIAVENNGILFAVNTTDNTFISYPVEKYVGRDVSQYGVTATALADGYTGNQTIDGVTYFVSSMTWKDSVLCVAVPLSTIYAQRMSTTLWVTGISLLIILLMSCFLIFSGKPAEHVVGAKEEKTAGSGRFFRILQDGRMRMVQSAESRWNGVRQPWSDKNPEQKLYYVAGIVVSVAVLALVCWLWVFDMDLEKGSIISYIMEQRWEKGFNLFSMSYSVIIVLEVAVISGIVRRLMMYVLTHFGARSETIGRLLDSFIKYAAIIGALYYCLGAIGVDSAALLTSAGIMSLIIGLGAQSLVSDILAGIFIVFEGEFRVGDIVTIGDWRGTVLEIGIRTTKIESPGSDIKIFNNSAISGVINMTKQFSYAFSDIGVEYGESLERVESVLQKELPLMKERLPAIENGPFYKGVASLGDSSVNIRIVAQCKEKDRVQLIRDMNRELKLIFDRHNINIPFPQIVLNQPAEHEQATRNEKKRAEAFVQEQKELTKDIHVREDS